MCPLGDFHVFWVLFLGFLFVNATRRSIWRVLEVLKYEILGTSAPAGPMYTKAMPYINIPALIPRDKSTSGQPNACHRRSTLPTTDFLWASLTQAPNSPSGSMSIPLTITLQPHPDLPPSHHHSTAPSQSMAIH